MSEDRASAAFPGTLRIATVAGISVHVHWSWALVAALELQWRAESYGSILWNTAEYLGLFAIVLLHEFGHAFACRSVGGEASHILLWPLGGIAYVRPPARPGALLWSIAAGPLVNVALVPVTIAAVVVAGFALGDGFADLQRALLSLAAINLGLLVFNILPVYPLDGGQIVRALLWFAVGPIRSLAMAAVVGLVGAAGLGLLALMGGDLWLAVLAAFAAWRSAVGFASARAQAAQLAGPAPTGSEQG